MKELRCGSQNVIVWHDPEKQTVMRRRGCGSRDFIQMGRSTSRLQLHCPVREKNGEATAASPRLRTAPHSDVASVFTDNSMRDPQPQTGALLTFCCEERLENLSPALSGDARPVVRNEDTNAAGFRVP